MERLNIILDPVADLQRIPVLLAQRRYGTEDIASICSVNVVRFVRDAWR